MVGQYAVESPKAQHVARFLFPSIFSVIFVKKGRLKQLFLCFFFFSLSLSFQPLLLFIFQEEMGDGG